MIRAARDLGAPIIIQTSPGTARYVGMRNFVAVCKSMAQDEIVDVVLHLDHCTNLTDIRDAIEAGFSSVMFDGSSLPFSENVAKSRRVIEFARDHGVSVEAEIGTIGGTEEGISNETGARWGRRSLGAGCAGRHPGRANPMPVGPSRGRPGRWRLA